MINFFDDDPLDPMARLAMRPGIIMNDPNKPVKIEPMSEEREKEILPRIAGMALGGIGYAGSVLEKTFGGRAMRGLLGGKPRELLSILPLSDTLGITSEEDRVSGRDLLRKHGFASDEDTWGNFVGGIATELFTDPGMYLTFGAGAVSKSGEIAKRLGVLPKTGRERATMTLRDLILGNKSLYGKAKAAAGGNLKDLAAVWKEPLGGLFGLQLPFGSVYGAPVTPMLSGGAAIKTLDAINKAKQSIMNFHTAASKMPYGLGFLYRVSPLSMIVDVPVLASTALDYVKRYGGSLLDARKMGAISKAGQESALVGHESIAPYAAKYRERLAKYVQELDALGHKDPNELRLAIEGIAASSNPAVNKIAQSIRRDYKEMLRDANRLGVRLEEFLDPHLPDMAYAPRHWVKSIGAMLEEIPETSKRLFMATDKSLSARRLRTLLGFKEGTVGVNKLFQDPILFADQLPKSARMRHVLDNYFADPNVVATELVSRANPGVPLTQLQKDIATTQKKVANVFRSRARTLVSRAERLPEEFKMAANKQLLDAKNNPIQFNVFGHHPLYEMMNYVDRMARLQGHARAAHHLIAQHARQLQSSDPLIRESVAVADALKKAGLSLQHAKNPSISAEQELLRVINRKRAAQNLPALTNLDDIYIPKDISQDLGRYLRSFDAPLALHPIIRWGVDYPLEMFRSLTTSLWPAFHVRNLFSGAAQNVARGAGKSLSDVPSAYNFMAGGSWRGLEEIPSIKQALVERNLPVTEKEANKLLSRLMFAHNLAGHTQHLGHEVLSPVTNTLFRLPVGLDDVATLIPGARPVTIKDALKTYIGMGDKGTINPVEIFRNVRNWSPVVGGQDIASIVESANRTPLFVEFLRKGYTPEQAAREVLKAHVDYSKWALTPTERIMMRRLMPFYSYTRGIIPEVLTQTLRYPGGFHGGLARIAGSIRQQHRNEFLPSYLGEGLAIPLSQEDQQGMKRFLTRIDLPTESAYEMFKGSYGDPVQATIMGLASQMNPMIKGPLEYAMDKQFFSGRELGDLYTMTGNYLLDQILFNSPFARFATTVRQVTDPRKWDLYSLPLNLLTGVKITDVDLEKYKMIAERDFLKQQLKGVEGIGKFETLSVKPEALPFLSDYELELVQLQRLLEKRARERKKENKEEIVIR